MSTFCSELRTCWSHSQKTPTCQKSAFWAWQFLQSIRYRYIYIYTLTGQKYLKSFQFSIIISHKLGLFMERSVIKLLTDTGISISNSYSTHSNYSGLKPSIAIFIHKLNYYYQSVSLCATFHSHYHYT